MISRYSKHPGSCPGSNVHPTSDCAKVGISWPITGVATRGCAHDKASDSHALGSKISPTHNNPTHDRDNVGAGLTIEIFDKDCGCGPYGLLIASRVAKT